MHDKNKKNNRILVLGSFVVDLMGRAHHLPLPGETVLGTTFKMGPGGKGSNQAVAAFRSGGNTVFITKLGKDLFSNMAMDFYNSEGMNTDFILSHPEQPTGTALILVDENTSQNSILVNSGACAHISLSDIEDAADTIRSSSIFLTQLETNLDILEPALRVFRSYEGREQRFAILNPAPVQEISTELLAMFDIITPNEVEASILSGIEVTDFKSAEISADYFIALGVKTVIITMGEQGCFIKSSMSIDGSTLFKTTIPRFTVNAIDSTGAGDAFNGGFAAALADGKSILDSAIFASAAAALSVTKIGTAPAMPQLSEIENLLKGK